MSALSVALSNFNYINYFVSVVENSVNHLLTPTETKVTGGDYHPWALHRSRT